MKTTLFLTLLLISFGVSSCVKKCKTAGLGGNLTMVAFPQHHTCTIINHVGWPDTVFVKYNTKEFPGASPSSYDTYFIGEVGEDHVHLPGFKCGDYYLYAVGFDSTCHGPTRVTGGIPYSTEAESGEVDINIPVTE